MNVSFRNLIKVLSNAPFVELLNLKQNGEIFSVLQSYLNKVIKSKIINPVHTQLI